MLHVVLLGGAPGVGKSSTAREVLRQASSGSALVQWVEVDALWSHQPWRVDQVTVAMLQANLAAVMSNAATAGVELLILTWVFQNTEMQDLVRRLAPEGSNVTTVQLRLGQVAWRRRWAADISRPSIDQFFEDRYKQAQATDATHVVDIDGLTTNEIATAVSIAIGLLPGL